MQGSNKQQTSQNKGQKNNQQDGSKQDSSQQAKGTSQEQPGGKQDSGQQAKGQQNSATQDRKQQQGQGVPKSQGQQQQAQKLEQQIQNIEQQLQGMSNRELKKISEKLESVERAMLLEKIDNQLHTMKETIVQPGDSASTSSAGAAAAVVVATQQPAD